MTARARWESGDLQLLRDRFADESTAGIAAALGRSYSATAQMATKLGLSKSAAYLASEAARRLNGEVGAACRFVKGQRPWNAGVKGSTGTHEACRAHQFTKGRPPSANSNYLPLGTTLVDADGYLVRKVSDDRAIRRCERWQPVHRLVWVQANGPVPAGHTVIFKAGRRTAIEADITLDALECISRVELMQRNSYHRYGPEIASVIQLRGVVNRQINKRSKEAVTP